MRATILEIAGDGQTLSIESTNLTKLLVKRFATEAISVLLTRCVFRDHMFIHRILPQITHNVQPPWQGALSLFTSLLAAMISARSKPGRVEVDLLHRKIATPHIGASP